MISEFVHLHNHTDNSLLDGAQTVDTLVNTISDLNMDAVGITEHGNLFSAISLYQKALKTGIKPIIGVEAYVAAGSRFDKKKNANGGWGYHHLVLLVQNYTGYTNLLKLVTAGYLEGFYYKPRVDKDLLREYSDGLICLSACLKGEVQEKAINRDYEGAKDAALEYAEIFPDRFYLEIQNHNIAEEEIARKTIKKLSRELNIPLVATNDCHYALQEHWEAHDILFCLGTGKDRDDPNRQKYATHEFYLKSQDQMWQLAKDYPGAIENSREITDLCNIAIPMGEALLPNFPIPENSTTSDPNIFLTDVCKKGLTELYNPVTPQLEKRLTYELGVIKKMQYAGYFLIVADFVKYAKQRSIPVGPGRGSAAGSLVSYTLGITTIDPIKHNLLFERFLNPDRISMPDIDIDFCYERRGEVIDYIKKQYGENSVTQIITFGKLKARQVVKDVGRVMGLSYNEMDQIAKMIPTGPDITLDKTLRINADFRRMAEGDKTHRDLVEFSKVLEGMSRHASTHAAGVVITPGELTDFVPLHKSSQGDITSQYDMKCLESLGLLKMDFLGLRNLTVIDKTVAILNKRGIDIDLEKIPMDDEKVYELFANGDTIGVFQFESEGMRDYLQKLKPTCIEDLIAMNALYRPGPMENIDNFIKRKHGSKKIHYINSKLKPILEETYGIIVYQEQVMEIAHTIAGFSLAEADMMRRAMGKKELKLMKQQGEAFIAGAVKNGLTKKVAVEIYNLIEKFAQYGFNKSHSTAYAYIAYQTAYLKRFHPAEFIAANLTSEMNNTTRIVTLINDCKRLKIKVVPPDVNSSEINFTAIDDKTISFGLNAIKNVGKKALESLVACRNKNGSFDNIFQFCEDLDLRVVNKQVIESLITSGAMDSLEGNRKQKYLAVNDALKYAQRQQAEKEANQYNLFGGESNVSSIHSAPNLPDVPEWNETEKLRREKDAIGYYITGHPLTKYSDELDNFTNYNFNENAGQLQSNPIKIGGIIQDVKLHLDKNNKQMSFFSVECLGGNPEVTAFPDTFSRYRNHIVKDNVVFISGNLSSRSNGTDVKVIAKEIYSLEEIQDITAKKVHVLMDLDKLKILDVDSLFKLAKDHVGRSPILFHLYDGGGNGKRIIAEKIRVNPNSVFLKKVKNLYGERNVWIE